MVWELTFQNILHLIDALQQSRDLFEPYTQLGSYELGVGIEEKIGIADSLI